MPMIYKMIAAYLLIINVAAFCAFGIDKRKAKKNAWRIPEKTLLALALLGGSAGALLGMEVFHHKTRKKKFSIGIPLILTVQSGLVCFLLWNF